MTSKVVKFQCVCTKCGKSSPRRRTMSAAIAAARDLGWLVKPATKPATAVVVCNACRDGICDDEQTEDVYHDSGEGPWATYDEADAFRRAEVEVESQVAHKTDGWHVFVATASKSKGGAR